MTTIDYREIEPSLSEGIFLKSGLEHSKKCQGYTLLELMLAVAICAVVGALATPSLVTSMANKRLDTSAYTINDSIAVARQAALSRASAVTLCPSNTGSGCTNTAWDDGWIAFVDSNANLTVDGPLDEILIIQAALNEKIAISTTAEIANGFVFRQNGQLNTFNTQVFTVCDDRGKTPWAKAIIMTFIGKSTVYSLSDANITTCAL